MYRKFIFSTRNVLFLLCVTLSCGMLSANDNVLPSWAMGGFIRPDGVNPLIAPTSSTLFRCPMTGKNVKWECADTFNPAAVVKDGKICILYRAEDDPNVGIGKRTSRIGYALTADGTHIDYRAKTPVMYPDSSAMSQQYEWPGGIEDPRVVEATIDGKTIYVMTHTAWNRDKARLSIATSTDLLTWTHHGPAFRTAYGGKFLNMFCKSGSIVTEEKDGRLQAARIKVNGEEKFLMYWGESWVCAAVSDDLINWTPIVDAAGELNYLVKPRKGFFDSLLTECGPPAVVTDRGILLFYNGKNGSSTNGDPAYPSNTYAAGQMLFSNENPLQLLDRLDKPFFRPMAEFEKTGQYASGTVFIEGLVLHNEKWYLYYGCADSFVGVAVYDPKNPTRYGDPIFLAQIPQGVINQQQSTTAGKMTCFVNSCSGMVNDSESPYYLNNSYIYPARKWCDTSTKHPWVVFELTGSYTINRLTFNDVGNREANCGNVPEFSVYVRNSTAEEWTEVAHQTNVENLATKDVSFAPVKARYVKLQLTRGIRPTGVEDSATRIYGVDIYGQREDEMPTEGIVTTGKTVLMSSMSSNERGAAQNLLTGAVLKDYAWRPTKGDPQTEPYRFVIIDLEDEYDLNRFYLYDAKYCDDAAKNIDTYQIYVSTQCPDLSLIDKSGDSNTCWTKIVDKRNTALMNRKIATLTTPVRARYLKLVLPRTSNSMNNVDTPVLYAFEAQGKPVEGTAVRPIAVQTMKQGSAYDIAGRLLEEPQKGQIYIKEGRKVLQATQGF